MFNKQTKTLTWFLTLFIAFFTVVSGKAHGGDRARYLAKEAEMITELRDYHNVDFLTKIEINYILNEVESEKYRWSPCLFCDLEQIYASENGHEELYFLWLVEKLDIIADLLDEEKSVLWELCRFETDLMDLVKEKEPLVYLYHERAGYTAEQIRGCLLGLPGRYDFTVLRDLQQTDLSPQAVRRIHISLN